MDNRTNMLLFFSLVVLFAFTFVFGVGALSQEVTALGVIALIGFVVCIGFSIFQSLLLKKDGSPMLLWFQVYTVVVGIVFVWFLTRSGTAAGIW